MTYFIRFTAIALITASAACVADADRPLDEDMSEEVPPGAEPAFTPIETGDPTDLGDPKTPVRDPFDDCLLDCYDAWDNCLDTRWGRLTGFCKATMCGCITGCGAEHGEDTSDAEAVYCE
jgi:hypothetical protein